MENVLSALLQCGSLDIDFINKILDEFDIDPNDAVEYLQDNFCNDRIEANALIYAIFEVALINCCEELSIEDVDLEEEIFCNCLDSHFFLKNKVGEWETIHSYEELKNFLTENYVTADIDAA
jgi:hypothetical protein